MRMIVFMKKPIIGITMGDPASIGPEITIKALADKNSYKKCRPLVIGDPAILQNAAILLGLLHLQIHPVKDVSEAAFTYGTIDVFVPAGLPGLSGLEPGKVSVQAGSASFLCVKEVIELAMHKQIDATVTNAISKEAINLAGHHFSGHTEIYASLTGTARYTMMLAHENMRVVHVSTHVSLREACDRVKKARVLEVIQVADHACRQLGIKKPKIGVAGLNPHSGENGMFGTEEIDEIIPAIAQAKETGIQADGPVPPDTLFSKARGGWYDIAVAMYHDQGHIPLKVVGFVYSREQAKWESVSGVNITLGLPIIRTSVDHGTAFDQAGKGTADPMSLVNAIDYAIQLVGV